MGRRDKAGKDGGPWRPWGWPALTVGRNRGVGLGVTIGFALKGHHGPYRAFKRVGSYGARLRKRGSIRGVFSGGAGD